MPTRRSPADAAPPELRQRILDTAESLLETEGLPALSMREVARRAGVTHQAPYHHFADRESILAELVTQGFGALTERMQRARHKALAGEREAMARESGAAYVGYAIDHPGIFRVMFRAELCDLGRFPAAQQAGANARAELDRLVDTLHGPGADPALAWVYWGQVHGLACLIVDGPLGLAMPGVRERRACMRQALGHFARAMMALPAEVPGTRLKMSSESL